MFLMIKKYKNKLLLILFKIFHRTAHLKDNFLSNLFNESYSLFVLGFTFVFFTLINSDCLGLHVNSQICLTKLFIQDGQRFIMAAASFICSLNLFNWQLKINVNY